MSPGVDHCPQLDHGFWGVFRVCFNHELTIWVFDMEAPIWFDDHHDDLPF